jgi:hypothetical protein
VGRVPLVKLQVYGVVPPVAASVVLYATLICPLGRELVVIANVAGAIVSVRLTVFVCFELSESCTWNVSGVLVTVAVGVPVIVPVDTFKLKPAGTVPFVMDHVYGVVPPLAAKDVL